MMCNGQIPELNVTIEQAQSYFASRLYTELWDNADQGVQEKALGWASSLIRSAFIFSDSAYNGNTWDNRIVFAVCEEALWLLGADPNEFPQVLRMGITSASAGSVSASFDKNNLAPLICRSAVTLVGELGSLIGGEGVVCSGLLEC